jgi:large subunit ribosomal protein L5
MKARMQEQYQEEVVPRLMKHFRYSSPMQVPRFTKVVLNAGVGEAVRNPKVLDYVMEDFKAISGQKPVLTRAKKSIAAFKLREGMPIGVKVTMRGMKMYHFLDKLIHIVLPRIRDFKGIPVNVFDGRGNCSIGVREQLIFPEVIYDKIDKIRGLEIIIVTTARSDEEGRMLLSSFGMPFEQND